MPSMSTPSIASNHRPALWRALIIADMNVIYWTNISDRYTTRDHWIKWFLAVTASGTVAAWGFWSQHPEAWKLLSLLSAGTAAAHPIIFSSERLGRMCSLVGTWKRIAANYELLWEQDDELIQPESWQQFAELKTQQASIDETRLPKDKKLIERAFDQALKKRGINV